MNYINDEYFLDHKSKMIYKKSIISHEKITDLNENEVLELIKNEDIQLCIHSEQNKLDWIEKNMTDGILERIKNHINHWDNQKDFTEFESGYCYFAELWKMGDGEKLILLYYRH